MNLSGTQLKDTYGNLLTIGTTAGSPTTGTLQNGAGEDISILTLGNSSATNHRFILQDSTTSARLILSSGDLYIDGDVDGVGNRDIIFRVDGGDESMRLESNGDISFQDTSNNEAFYWDASEANLLLGTNTDAGVTDGLTIYKSSGTAGINFNANVYGADYSIVSGATGADAFGIYDNDASAYRMVIDSSGNVGIGETSPTAPLQIKTDTSAGSAKVAQFLTHADVTSGTEVRLAFAAHTNIDIATDRYSYISALNTSGSNGQALVFATNAAGAGGTERMRITSDGYVGIGTGDTDVQSGDLIGVLAFNSKDISTNSSGAIGSIRSYATAPFNTGAVSGDLRFYTQNNGAPSGSLLSGTERMRIDSSGNVIVGNTSYNNDNVGVGLGASGFLYATRDGSLVSSFNRLTSDGTIADFRKDGTVVGSIGTFGSDLFIGTNDSGLRFEYAGTNAIVPFDVNSLAVSDNATDLGASGARFKDIYATNGTIQTSDINEKQDIEELDDAELRVAQKAKTLLRKYRWKSSVEEKSDDARIHFGIIAQDLEQAFTDEGLDAGRYGMFIKSTWTNEEGEEQTRLGVRYNQLLAFIISAL